jgi:hypothetical protein
MFSGRNYFIIGAGVGVMMFILINFFSANIVSFVNQTMNGARPLLGDLVRLVGEPIKLLFSDPVIGAVISALFWPLGLVLLVLFIIMMLVALGGGAVLDIGNSVQRFNP